MKNVVASRLVGLTTDPFRFDVPHVGQPLNLFRWVSVEEVYKLLGEIPSKSSPMDFVPTSVLKRCRRVFAPLIARLANLSFQEGRFPSQFKRAQVTPLIKHDGLDTSDPANYRPISNLNTISRSSNASPWDDSEHILQIHRTSTNRSRHTGVTIRRKQHFCAY